MRITERVFFKNLKGIPSLGTQYSIFKGILIAMQEQLEQRQIREVSSLCLALRGFPGRECKAFDSSAGFSHLAKNLLLATISLPDFLPTARLCPEIPLLTLCNPGPRSL